MEELEAFYKKNVRDDDFVIVEVKNFYKTLIMLWATRNESMSEREIGERFGSCIGELDSLVSLKNRITSHSDYNKIKYILIHSIKVLSQFELFWNDKSSREIQKRVEHWRSFMTSNPRLRQYEYSFYSF
jgi:hypothetical protein